MRMHGIRPLFITEGKYWNQLKKFRKFRDVLSSGSHETGGTAKKVTASDSAKPGPQIHTLRKCICEPYKKFSNPY